MAKYRPSHQRPPQRQAPPEPPRFSADFSGEFSLKHYVMIALIVVGIVWIFYDMYEPYEPIEKAVNIEDYEATFNALRLEGLLVRVNYDQATAVVSDNKWATLPPGQKNYIAVFLSNYIARRLGTPQFQVKIVGVSSKVILGEIDSAGVRMY